MGGQGRTHLEVSDQTTKTQMTRNTDATSSYFKAPNYDSSAIDFVESSKQPFAVTEFLTLLAGPQDVSNFTKPALVKTYLLLLPILHSPALLNSY